MSSLATSYSKVLKDCDSMIADIVKKITTTSTEKSVLEKRLEHLRTISNFAKQYIHPEDIDQYMDACTARFFKQLPTIRHLHLAENSVSLEDEQAYLTGKADTRRLSLVNITKENRAALRQDLTQRISQLGHATQVLHALSDIVSTPVITLEQKKVDLRINVTRAYLAIVDHSLGTITAAERDHAFTTYSMANTGPCPDDTWKSAVSHMSAVFEYAKNAQIGNNALIRDALHILKQYQASHINPTLLIRDDDHLPLMGQHNIPTLKAHSVTPAQEVEFFSRVLHRHHLDQQGWTAQAYSGSLTKVIPGKKIIYCPSQRVLPLNVFQLGTMYFHEFGGHASRKISGAQTVSASGKTLAMLASSLPLYTQTEESLAVISELQICSDILEANVHIMKYAIRLFIAYRMTTDSSHTCYRTLDHEVSALWSALQTILTPNATQETVSRLAAHNTKTVLMRATRGVTGTTPGTGFIKDWIYFGGIRNILDLLKEDPQHLALLYLGKIDISHLPLMKELGFSSPFSTNLSTFEEFSEIINEMSLLG